jgi:hypothetical protein
LPDKRSGPAYGLRMELSTGSFVSFGWETFKKRPWFFIGASVVVLIVYLVAGSLVEAIDSAF